ncbi:ATP-NAD kinase [Artomyces pyxidatus]|uniref:ATP-NAD kinase n=1 Tax=Artomyces pyxidatus TaxID=48021 RepID=A0ACB8TC53_9AGAM|nr:ATP-NAD kinase [Artomyces pyxidatus]
MPGPVLSPDTEVFSTPPSTPMQAAMPPDDGHMRPSLSRASSRPSNLHISETAADWKPDIVVVGQSPSVPNNKSPMHPNTPRASAANGQTNGHAKSSSHLPASVSATHSLPDDRPLASSPASYQPAGHILRSPHTPHSNQSPMMSPCFVHSNLDKGASFAEWLKTRHGVAAPGVGVARNLYPSDNQPSRPRRYRKTENGQVIPVPYEDGMGADNYEGDGYAEYEEDETSGSLTKQLAETAVGVREMSKQLGRARIKSNIQNVLIVTKARDNRLITLTRDLALYLMKKPRYGGRGLVVYVDHQLRTSRRFDAAGIERDHPELFVPFPRRRSSSNNSLSSVSTVSNDGHTTSGEEGQLRYWTAEMCSRSPHLFDFVVTLGGDGTVLFTSWLFQRIVPPVLPFALGSLGFLTNFDFADHQATMDSALESGIRVNLRMRFTCTVYRAVSREEMRRSPKSRRKAVKKGETGEIMMRNLEKGGWEALEGGYHNESQNKCSKDKEIMCFTTRPVECFEVLNDLVVDRGPSPYVSMLELFGDEHHMTTVQGDGLTISTPTGSTAYSLSAGGSLVHPEIPSILITPIAPHTLSFRPMLLPDSMEVRICVPFNSRSTAWVSFDGRGRVELKQGDHIKVTASKYPFPTVCADKQSTDWFHAISRTLKWNDRERQKSFVVVEEGPVKARKKHQNSVSSIDSAESQLRAPANSEASPTSSLGDVPGEEDDERDDSSDDDDSDYEDEEEEEEKFDIDDLTPETTTVDLKRPTSEQTHATAEAKATEQHEEAQAERAVEAIMGVKLARARASSRSRSGLRSGVDSPDRFAGPHPHVPPRHVQFAGDSTTPSPSESSASSASLDWRQPVHVVLGAGAEGAINPATHAREDLKTPTAAEHTGRRQRSKPRWQVEEEGAPHVHPRAFAVWGQDESDSNPSDSDL